MNAILRLAIVAVIVFGGFLLVRPALDRRDAFRTQAQAGQPIVRAIEDYHNQTGQYPASLSDLVPQYLPTLPDPPDESRHKFSGWDYSAATGDGTFYSLRYYMGHGGVEYDPPKWVGNDEGSRSVILINQ